MLKSRKQKAALIGAIVNLAVVLVQTYYHVPVPVIVASVAVVGSAFGIQINGIAIEDAAKLKAGGKPEPP